jgi:SAM-dependent methyltransferase
MSHYPPKFYERQSSATRTSADLIVPMLVDLVRPQSVVDVGCGTGNWLRAFGDNGIGELRGFDGPWLDVAQLLIPREIFTHADLEKPVDAGRRFDLAISLEVAEHLSPSAAEGFVNSLTALSDVVVFSAAIPFQGGENHLNEQWPEYWEELFAKRGYVAIDCLRWRLWNEKSVHYWYRQNMLVYANEEMLDRYPRLAEERRTAVPGAVPLVHPSLYIPGAAFLRHMGLIDATRLWGRVFTRTLKKNFRRIFMPSKKTPAFKLPARPQGAPMDATSGRWS